VQQARYIAQDNPDAADRFLDACEHTLEALAELPDVGAPRQFDNPALQGIRMWCVKGFEKHLVFYRRVEDGVDIVRILHAARDIQRIMKEESV